MYKQWKKIEFSKQYCIRICNQQDQEADQEVDGKRKYGRMKEYLQDKSGRKKYINREGCKKILRTARNGHIMHKPME
jgi:hypothetical protein